MSEPLWSDERIFGAIAKAQDNALHFGNDHLDTVQLFALMSEMRDEYEALLPDAQTRVTLDIILRFAEADHANRTPFGSQITHCQRWLKSLERLEVHDD